MLGSIVRSGINYCPGVYKCYVRGYRCDRNNSLQWIYLTSVMYYDIESVVGGGGGGGGGGVYKCIENSPE